MTSVKLSCSKCFVILILADSEQRPRRCGSCTALGSLSEVPAQCNCPSCGTLYAAGLPACPSCHVHRVTQRASTEGGPFAPYEVDTTLQRRDPLRPKPDGNLHTVSRKPQQTRVPAIIFVPIKIPD